MVTDEMVEKAERVYWDASNDPEGARDMRAALEAALSAAEPHPAPSVAVKALIEEFFKRNGWEVDNGIAYHEPGDISVSSVSINDLHSALSAQVKDVAGWQLVPKQPTEEMLDAYWGQTGESEAMRSRVHARAKIHYHVMLAAAPAKQEA